MGRGGAADTQDCPFEYQLPYMPRELSACNLLRRRGCALIPSITAYVYERTEAQVIGFICEEFEGTLLGLMTLEGWNAQAYTLRIKGH